MIDRLISAAPATLHVAFKETAVKAVRPVDAVVARQRADDGPKRTAERSTEHGTTYTPHAKHDEDKPLYSHKGKPSASSGVFATASYDKTESLDLKVRTAEGDVVTLSFSESNSATVSAGAVNAGPTSSTALSLDTSQSSDLRISVKGQLSDEERAAINALASQVSQVADDFFSGNTAQAQKDASQIDISGQSSALSAYSFKLASRETQMAAAIYDNVAQTTLPVNDQPNTTTAAESTTPVPANNSGPKDLLKNLMALFNRLAGQPQPEPTKAA